MSPYPLTTDEKEIVTLAIAVWFLLFVIANYRLRRIPLEKRARNMPNLAAAAIAATTPLTLVITVLINMYFPELLQQYSVMALYTTGIVGSVYFTIYILYTQYWKQVRAIEKKTPSKQS